jgi:hypothetical protein
MFLQLYLREMNVFPLRIDPLRRTELPFSDRSSASRVWDRLMPTMTFPNLSGNCALVFAEKPDKIHPQFYEHFSRESLVLPQ